MNKIKEIWWHMLGYGTYLEKDEIDTTCKINRDIRDNANCININEIYDGYHTFGELYEHRIKLYLSLLSYIVDDKKYYAWYSHKHFEGDSWNGWIVVGVQNNETGEQISYHINSKYEPHLVRIGVDKREYGLEWDGHDSEEVLARLMKWMVFK